MARRLRPATSTRAGAADDPARARDQQPGHRAYLKAAELRAGIAHEADPRDQIRDYLLRGVERGTVQDRAGVVAACRRRASTCRARASTT